MARARRGRHEGSIYQRQDGRWVGSASLAYTGDGRRKRKVVYGKSKAEVQEKLREVQGLAASGTLPDAKGLTVGRFLDAWLESVKQTVAAGTHTTYEQHVRNLIKPHIGGVRLDGLKPLHVAGLYSRLAADGSGTAMQRKAGVTLRTAISWAVATDLLATNPVKRVKMPAHRPAEVQPLTLEQLTTFLNAARADRLYAVYVLAVDAGCRQGELLALTWRDVDLDLGTVSVTKSLEEVKGQLRIKEPKRQKGRRLIQVSPFTVEALHGHRAAMIEEESYRPDGPVFCGRRSRTWLRKSDIYRHSFQPLLKGTGLEFNFHVLRHSCATFLLAAGSDVKTVQERLGHSTAVMTLNTYAHFMPGAQAGAAAKLDAILTTTRKSAAAKKG